MRGSCLLHGESWWHHKYGVASWSLKVSPERLFVRLQVPDMAMDGVLEALNKVSVPASSAEEELDFHVCAD